MSDTKLLDSATMSADGLIAGPGGSAYAGAAFDERLDAGAALAGNG